MADSPIFSSSWVCRVPQNGKNGIININDSLSLRLQIGGLFKLTLN